MTAVPSFVYTVNLLVCERSALLLCFQDSLGHDDFDLPASELESDNDEVNATLFTRFQ